MQQSREIRWSTRQHSLLLHTGTKRCSIQRLSKRRGGGLCGNNETRSCASEGFGLPRERYLEEQTVSLEADHTQVGQANLLVGVDILVFLRLGDLRGGIVLPFGRWAL